MPRRMHALRLLSPCDRACLIQKGCRGRGKGSCRQVASGGQGAHRCWRQARPTRAGTPGSRRGTAADCVLTSNRQVSRQWQEPMSGEPAWVPPAWPKRASFAQDSSPAAPLQTSRHALDHDPLQTLPSAVAAPHVHEHSACTQLSSSARLTLAAPVVRPSGRSCKRLRQVAALQDWNSCLSSRGCGCPGSLLPLRRRQRARRLCAGALVAKAPGGAPLVGVHRPPAATAALARVALALPLVPPAPPPTHLATLCATPQVAQPRDA